MMAHGIMQLIPQVTERIKEDMLVEAIDPFLYLLLLRFDIISFYNYVYPYVQCLPAKYKDTDIAKHIIGVRHNLSQHLFDMNTDKIKLNNVIMRLTAGTIGLRDGRVFLSFGEGDVEGRKGTKAEVIPSFLFDEVLGLTGSLVAESAQWFRQH
jgi:hypothetical protein